jgi:hypothetical protein
MAGLVRLNDVWRMLEHCLPGHIRGLVNFFDIPADCYEPFLRLR